MPYDPKNPKTWPDHVRKHKRRKGKRWAHIWNSVFEQTGSEERAFKAANASLAKGGNPEALQMIEQAPADGVSLYCPFTKIDRQNRMVYGILTGEKIDKQGDIMDFDGSVEALSQWAGNIREMHQPKVVGWGVKVLANRKTREIGLLAKIGTSYDGENAWRKVLDRELRGYSVGGPPPLKATTKGVPPPARRRVLKWRCNEVSLVDVPAYRGSQLQVVLAKRATDGSVVPEGVLMSPVRGRSITGLLLAIGMRGHPEILRKRA